MSTYEQNRAKFTVEELHQYEGKWVAFSPDGSRIVASADDLLTLEDLVVAAGEDSQEVGTERIVLEDDWQGAAELE